MQGLPKEALDEYIGETREMCERVSINLGLVEKKEHDDETLNSIYRDMHSIKGSSYLFGFKHIGELAHAMETVLDPIRHKSVVASSAIIDALYGGLDLITKMMESIVASGEEGAANASNLSKIVPRIADLSAASLGADLRVLNDHSGVAESHDQWRQSVTDDSTNSASKNPGHCENCRGCKCSAPRCPETDACGNGVSGGNK